MLRLIKETFRAGVVANLHHLIDSTESEINRKIYIDFLKTY